MKRMIYLLVLFFCSLNASAQPAEPMRMYTDKDCYLAGEKLWIKISLDENASPENLMSRVAYVEIGDTAQIHAQGKIDLQNGNGWACIQLPTTMHSGIYQLMAYTRYMRNWGTDCFPRKYLAVINARTHGENDKLKADKDLILSANEQDAFTESLLKSDRLSYPTRNKVTLKWDTQLSKAKELTLTVVRKDCQVQLPQAIHSTLPTSVPNEKWIAECEGHIVTAQPRNKNTHFPIDLSAQMGCVGKEIKVFEGWRKENDHFVFYTNGVVNQQDIVLASHNTEDVPCQLDVVSPFVEQLPESLPNLHCQYHEGALTDRSVALQINQAMPLGRKTLQMVDILYGQKPYKTYNLDEYVRFNTVQECITEFVMGIAVDKENNRKVIRQLQENSKDYNMFPVLVLIDGVPFHNHEEVINYSARQIQYIHQYRSNYTLGEKIFGGILSLVTHSGNLPDIRIGENMQMVAYEFPQSFPTFDLPQYPTEEEKQSRKPDFRHTLYWNPCVTGTSEVEFYTSDMEGIYVAKLQGVLSNGQKINEECTFIVER